MPSGLTMAESTINRALARCALLPLFALVNLREKSCEDVHDSVCWRFSPSPIHRPATAARPYGLPELPTSWGLTITKRTINRALARCALLPVFVWVKLREKSGEDVHDSEC